MIEILFCKGNYELREEGKLVGFQSNIFDAMEMASKEANGQPFMVNCQIPKSELGNKSFYVCPKCGGAVNLRGALPMGDFEPFSKDEFAHCAECVRDYVISWLPDPYKEV